MLAIFNKYNIPNEIRGHIFSFIKMRDEFNTVLHEIDTGIHTRILYMGEVDTGLTDIYGFSRKVKRTIAAADAYRPRYSSIHPDPSKNKFKHNILLSDKYDYHPVGWPNFRSQSDPHILCYVCNYRKRYTDKHRAHLTGCRCSYESILWKEQQQIHHEIESHLENIS